MMPSQLGSSDCLCARDACPCRRMRQRRRRRRPRPSRLRRRPGRTSCRPLGGPAAGRATTCARGGARRMLRLLCVLGCWASQPGSFMGVHCSAQDAVVLSRPDSTPCALPLPCLTPPRPDPSGLFITAVQGAPVQQRRAQLSLGAQHAGGARAPLGGSHGAEAASSLLFVVVVVWQSARTVLRGALLSEPPAPS